MSEPDKTSPAPSLPKNSRKREEKGLRIPDKKLGELARSVIAQVRDTLEDPGFILMMGAEVRRKISILLPEIKPDSADSGKISAALLERGGWMDRVLEENREASGRSIDTPIRKVPGFSTITRNALFNGGIFTLGEITKFTAKELLMLKNFGKTRCLPEVKAVLRLHGLHLKGEEL